MTPIDVVGIGADGWGGLAPASRDAVSAADVLFGSTRQLDSIPADAFDGERIPWPSPMIPALPGLLDSRSSRRRCVLASGDPMFHGIGTTLVRLLGIDALRIHSHSSSASIACARLGWALDAVEIVSVVARPVETIVPSLAHGRRLLVLSENEVTPAAVARTLCAHGFGESEVTVLSQLGGPAETVIRGRADTWADVSVDPLNIVAVQLSRSIDARRATRVPGLPDELYSGDGQLTKAEVRALTLSALAPAPGELMWDVGGGSGSIAIEWMRTHPSCRAEIFEQSQSRRTTIAENARTLGVPALSVRGEAPQSFADLPAPAALFVGGGATEPGLLDECWARLHSGGRIVVNAVTAESEALLLQWYSMHGGLLRKFQIYRGEPLGSFTAWRPQLPVAQWVATKVAV